jgi:hypothetical protein
LLINADILAYINELLDEAIHSHTQAACR